jgi:hypothetical protein
MNMGGWWNDTGKGSLKYFGEKPIQVSLYPPKNMHGLALDQTWAFTMRGQQTPPKSWHGWK